MRIFVNHSFNAVDSHPYMIEPFRVIVRTIQNLDSCFLVMIRFLSQ